MTMHASITADTEQESHGAWYWMPLTGLDFKERLLSCETNRTHASKSNKSTKVIISSMR